MDSQVFVAAIRFIFAQYVLYHCTVGHFLQWSHQMTCDNNFQPFLGVEGLTILSNKIINIRA